MATGEQKTKNIGRLLIVGTAICYGLAGVCVKSVTWSSLPIVFVRSLVSLLMLFCMKKSLKVNFSKQNILAGFFASSTGVLYILALKLTNAGTSIVLQYIAPILIFLYAVFFKKRKTTPFETLMVVAIFNGVVISFADSLEPEHILGNSLALASGFTFATQIVMMNNEKTNPTDALIIADLFSMAVSVYFFFFDGTVTFTTNNIFWVAIMALVQYGLANVLFSKGVHMLDEIEVSLILTIEPIFNPIPVAIFCGEYMSPLAILGAAIVIVGVAAFSVYQNKRKTT